MKEAEINEVAASSIAGLAIDEFQYFVWIDGPSGEKTRVPSGAPVYYVRFMKGGGYSGPVFTSKKKAISALDSWTAEAKAKLHAERRRRASAGSS